MELYKNYINGAWVESAGKKTTPNINPADTSDQIGRVKHSTPKEVKEAIAAAQQAWPGWRGTPAPQRGRMIEKARLALEKRKDETARALTREEGKIAREAAGEVTKTLNLLEFMAGEAMRLTGETVPSELPSTFAYTIRQPIGVVGAITPWNFPVAIPFWKIAPALVAGCTVVFKPATLTPHTAQIVTECFVEAGAPPGVPNMIYGSGEQVGEGIVGHPAVRAISFTGSNDVGLATYAAAAAQGKKVQCEMGGKNPVLVLDDADLELAADGIAQGAFGSTGQRCTATSRVVVTKKVAGALTKLILRRARTMTCGTDLGPSIDETQLNTVLRYIDIGKLEGADLAVGGGRPRGLDRGYYVEPTVFTGVRSSMRIAQEEIFGPVLVIMTVKDFDEGLRVCNDVKYGLTSSIYTRDAAATFRFIDGIETGITHVNSPTMGGEAQLPFGGTKATGVGPREMGRSAIDFYSEVKTVYVDYTGNQRTSNIY